ncbi:MAG TPA: metallophosphoesterase [Candidatus Nanoarchaeia archaeon]|nr:metallophosphoesterase [Candidatus Nanoarchaeia archaeon]
MERDNKNILGFCFKKGIIVDNQTFNLFEDVNDEDSIKFLLERIKNNTGQKFINKDVLKKNKEKIKRFLLELSKEKQQEFDIFKNKIGLDNNERESKKENITKKNKKDQNKKISGRVNLGSRPDFPNKQLGVKDFVNYFKSRHKELKNILQEHAELDNLVSINRLSGNTQGVSLIGIVSDKKVTKNKNILLQVEDLTGSIRVLINQNKPELYKKAEEISLDSVLGFKGSGNKEIIFANEIVFPEARLPEKKKSPIEEYALFIGDLHFGSKLFLKKSFENFIYYLSEDNPDSHDPNNKVSKIKYLVLIGDIITGVGNYPDQEKDLEIKDLEKQFLEFSKYLEKIRKDIKIIAFPGNHDCVRLMEPQPVFDEKFAWPLFQLENIIISENPARFNIGATKDFSGFDVLGYHGFSFPYYANNIPSLIEKDAMNAPAEIMKYLLKNRHLAPAHTSTQYYPSEEDPLLIKKIPDIFVSGHTHKAHIENYNNISLISVSCWEAMTSYQEKMGNKPDHCKVPMFNLKKGNIRILDFEDKEESEEKKLAR